MVFPDDEEREGLKRLGLYADAQYLSQLLLRTLQYVVPAGSEAGALERNEGRRSFALELLTLMELREQPHDRRPDAAELARTRTSGIATGQRGISRRLPTEK